MDIYKIKFTRLQNQILRFLCVNSGKDFSKREIAIKLKVSPTAVAKSLVLLEKEELILVKREKTLNLNSVSLDRNSQKAINFKRTENLKIIHESNLQKFLEESFPGTTIILFGSYSKGEDVFNSDIDMAIIGTKMKTINLKNFEDILKREIIINFYKNWKEINKELKDNILNGIVLSGGIDL